MSQLSKSQELELLASLESKGESPLKFAYLGDGYEKWVSVANSGRNSEQRGIYKDQISDETIAFLFRDVPEHVNIVDLGCGDGLPIFPVLKEILSYSHVKSLRYTAVDISPDMLKLAEKNVVNEFEDSVDVFPMLLDLDYSSNLENLIESSLDGVRNYFFVLGGTLGNFSSTKRLLEDIANYMLSDDKLIIENQISNYLSAKKTTEYYKKPEVYELVSHTVNNYGLETDITDFSVKWNDEKRQIEMYLALPKKQSIEIQGRKLEFEADEEILLARSKKFQESDLVDIFSVSGFRIDFFTSNEDKTKCILAATPTRYRS